MRKMLSAGAMVLLIAFSFSSMNCSRTPAVTVKANRQVVELVKTWGSDVSFYTSKKDPLKSVEGLRQQEIGCYGKELVPHIQAFYDAAGVEREFGNAVQVIGPDNPIFLMERGPRLYLTSPEYAKRLKEAVKVRFSE
jgi:hypothetical protein